MEVSLNKKALALTLVLTVVITFGLTPAAQAVMGFDLMSILKLFGIGYVVKQFGPQINEAINTLAFSRKWETKDVTKVVPILSGELSTSGSGAYIGAAQVSGPQEQVDKVQAVAQIEGDFHKALRLKMLVPVDNLNPLEMSRVFGVGVSAIVDINL